MRMLMTLCLTLGVALPAPTAEKLGLALPALTAEKPADAEASARAIAPYLDSLTIAVVHLNVARLDVDALFQTLVSWQRLRPADVSVSKDAVRRWVDEFTQAGGKEVYFVVSLEDLPGNGPFMIVPLGANADAMALTKLLGGLDPSKPSEEQPRPPFKNEVAEKIDRVVFSGTKQMRERMHGLKPAPHPELAQAFAAVGDADLQIVFIASADLRRVLEETSGTLPPELGGGPGKVLTRGLKWAGVSATAPPHLALRFVAQARDAAAAQALRDLAVNALKALGEQPKIRQAFPDFDRLARQLTPTVQVDRLTVALNEQDVRTLALPLVAEAQVGSNRTRTVNRLRQIGLALHNYHDVNKTFPPAYTCTKDGKPLLSWRVHILPYLDQDALYKEFHLDEPWDSEHNKPLIARMPVTYQTSPKLEKGKTTCLGLRGEQTMFPDCKPVAIKEVTDGTSNTIFVVDADDAHAVVWTKPDDLKYDPANPIAGLVGHFEGQFLALLVDGSVQVLPQKTPAKTLNALFTRNGGELVEWPGR